MATETTGSSGAEASSAGGEGAGTSSATTAGGSTAAGSASSTTEAGTDWKAKYEELERKHSRLAGREGSVIPDLQRDLASAQAEAATAKAQAAAAAKELHETKVLEAVLAKAPEKTRAAIRLAARGIIPVVAETDPEKAAAAVISQIEAAAPELVKPTVATHPHVNGGQPRSGLYFTKDGQRVV